MWTTMIYDIIYHWYDEEMMMVLFADIFGQNISDCTNRICLSLLKPESFKTKFDYLFFSGQEKKLIIFSSWSWNIHKTLKMKQDLYTWLTAFYFYIILLALQLFLFAWEHTFCPSALLVHHMKEVKEGSLGNWIFVKSPILLLRPTPDSLCRFSAASPLQDS